MMAMDSLSRTARATLPAHLREEWFRMRGEIRRAIRDERYTAGPRARYVSWDDPEFVARCALKLAELHQQVDKYTSRFAGE